MKLPTNLRQEIREALRLSMPLMAALLAQIGMETVDVLMMGRLSTKALAAGALGSAVYLSLLIFCVGMLLAVGVLVARYHGGRKPKSISKVLWQGVYLALALSVPCILLMIVSDRLLMAIGQEPSLVALMDIYLYALAWGVPATLLFLCFREFLSGLGHPRIIMVISLIALPCNALVNYILMFGKLGFPKLGLAGIGYATSLIDWAMFITLILFIYSQKRLRRYLLMRQRQFSWVLIQEIVKIGWPVGVMMALEIGLFSISSIFMGYFGEYSLAAHQIALQCLSLVFMLPLGIGQAAGILVGHALGAKDPEKAKRMVYINLAIGQIIAVFTALIFFIVPQFLIGLYVNLQRVNPQVINLGVNFLFLAALFQFGDALQVIANGALRGYKDTFIPMLLGLLSYWIIGLGSGYYLAFVRGWQGVGLWCGLAIGITISGLLLFCRLYRRLQMERQVC